MSRNLTSRPARSYLLSFVCFALSGNVAVGGITADWNSTTKTLTVNYTSQNGDIAQITKDGSNNVSVLENGNTPVTIYDNGYPSSVSVGAVENLVVNGSGGSDWLDCYHVMPANGWTALISSKLYGNGGGDDIDGTGIDDIIYGDLGADIVDGKVVDDYLMDAEVVDLTANCMRRIWYFDNSVGVNWNSTGSYATRIADNNAFVDSGFTTYQLTRRKSLATQQAQAVAIGNSIGPTMDLQLPVGDLSRQQSPQLGA